jgi:hypothetical protein
MSLDGWRYAPTPYCPHGCPLPSCQGSVASGVAPCADGDYRYCAHGVPLKVTRDGQPLCAACRGVSRRQRNPDTWQPIRHPVLVLMGFYLACLLACASVFGAAVLVGAWLAGVV